MDTESLRLFCDLAETGSFSKTAERHFISQSAVSQRMRALEDEFGCRLVERGRGRPGAALSEAGERVLIASREILARIETLRRELAELSGAVTGSLNVATVYSIGLHSLTPAVTRFLAEYPQVNLRLEYLRTDRIYDALLAGTIDCGIVACPRPRSPVEVLPLDVEEMVLILPPAHPLARLPSVPIDALSGLPFIAFDPDIPTRGLIDGFLEARGVTVRVVQAFDNIETIKCVVEIGIGVALVPEPTVQREARDGALAVRRLEGGVLTRPTGILLRRGRGRSRALTRFLEALGAVELSPAP